MKIPQHQYARTLYMWNGVSAIFMYGSITPPHSHNTLQIVFGIRNMFKCKLDTTDWQSYPAVVIQENAIHQLDPANSMQLLLYVDASGEIAKNIRAKYLERTAISALDINIADHINPGELEKCLIEPNAVLLEQVVYRLLNIIAGNNNTVSYDNRVKEIIRSLAGDHSANITISILAKKVHLSESRLRFLFKKTLGVPLHRYIIWNRIMSALTKIMNGDTIEKAAQDSGFTDTSHFHKLLLQMFGVSPSGFIKNNSQKNLRLCTATPFHMETRFYNEYDGEEHKVYTI